MLARKGKALLPEGSFVLCTIGVLHPLPQPYIKPAGAGSLYMAVHAVCCELVSTLNYLLTRENTGNPSLAHYQTQRIILELFEESC